MLRGQALEEAEAWAKDKRLSNEDEQFLQASRTYEKTEREKELVAERRRNELLAEANQSMEKASASAEQQNMLLAEANQTLTEAKQEADRKIRKADSRNKFSLLLLVVILAVSTSLVGFVQLRANQEASFAKTNMEDQERRAAWKELRSVLASRSSQIFLDSGEFVTGIFERRVGVAEQKIIKTQIEGERIREESAREIKEAEKEAVAKVKEAKIESDEILADATEKVRIANGQLKDAERVSETARIESSFLGNVADLERQGFGISRLFENQQTEGLLKAHRSAFEADRLFDEATGRIPNASTLNYMAITPLIALQNSLNTIRETRLEGHKNDVYRVAFGPEGSILTAGEDGTVRLWDIQGNPRLQIEPETRISRAVFSSDGTLIAAVGSDNTVRLWDRQGNSVLQIPTEGEVRQVVFSSDGSLIATMGFDGKVQLWDRQGANRSTLLGVSSMFASPSHDFVVLVNETGVAQLTTWNEISNLRIETPIPQQTGTLTSASDLYEARGTYADRYSFQGRTGQPIEVSLTSPNFDAYLYLLDAEGNILAENDDGGGNNNSRLTYRLPANGTYQVVATTFSPEANGSYELKVRSQIGPPSIATMEHRGGVNEVAFSSDGNFIAAAGGDGKVQIWNRPTNQITKIAAHSGSVLHVAFSPNGQSIATVGVDNITRLWTTEGQQMAQYEGHGVLNHDWTQVAVVVQPNGLQLHYAVEFLHVYTIDRISELLAASCDRLRPYLTHSPNVSDADRELCEIPPR